MVSFVNGGPHKSHSRDQAAKPVDYKDGELSQFL